MEVVEQETGQGPAASGAQADPEPPTGKAELFVALGIVAWFLSFVRIRHPIYYNRNSTLSPHPLLFGCILSVKPFSDRLVDSTTMQQVCCPQGPRGVVNQDAI